MRIGLVGLSTPLFYDYSGPAHRDRTPNPILDSPFGVMLLYDKLWFLTRDLCPENLRSSDFVRFLNEDGGLPDLDGLDPFELSRSRLSEYEALSRARSSLPDYGDVVRSLRMDWPALPDNHGRSVSLGRLNVMGNAGTPENILFDLAVIERLDRRGLELIGNTFGQRTLEQFNPAVRDADLAHVMVIDDIPNYLSPEGPYHPVIDEVREDRFLKDFRRWISETTRTSIDEAQAVKADVEQRIREAQEELFLNHLDPNRKYYSVAKTLTTTAASTLVPGSGAVASTIAELRDDRRVRDQRYQGFLVGLKRAARRHRDESGGA
jgi:hypothetical protein